MNNFIELFREFMVLSYSRVPKATGRIRDIALDNYIIARIGEEGGLTIHYLYSGDSIYIPAVWISLFSELNVHSGDRILNMPIEEDDTGITEFGILFTKLMVYLDSGLSTVSGSVFLDILGDICSSGTGKFRKFLSTEFGVSPGPIEYRTILQTTEL